MEEGKPFIPDYSKYTLSELEDIYSRMQKDKFIERVEAIENEIKRKKESLNKNPTLENLETSSYNYEYAGFWKRAGATALDGIIGFLLFPLINFIHTFSFENKTIIPIAIQTLLLLYLFQMFFIMKYGGTLGKLIMNLRVINNKGTYLDFSSIFLRIIPYLIITIVNLFQINHAIQTIPSNITSYGIFETSQLIQKYGGLYTALYSLLSFFVFIDIGTVLFNDKKRAIHDYLAGSFVVTKMSLDKIENVKVNLNYT